MDKGLFILSVLITAALADDDPLCAGLPTDVEILFPFEGSCEYYFRCFEGIFSFEGCPDGLFFSNKAQDCVLPEHSECGDTTTKSPTTTTTTAPTTTTTTRTTPSTTTSGHDPRCADNSTSCWPHPSRCDKYIECYLGGSTERDCLSGLYFSDIHKQCVDASESECCSNNISQCRVV